MSSNDLSQVRGYINSRMKIVEPDYSEWLDSLEDIGNIPKTILDRTYHITLNPITSSAQIDSHIEDDFSVTITTFKRGFNTPVLARDEAMQTANCIRLDIINHRNIETYKVANDGNIEDVVSISITPSDIDSTNDNIIKIETELNVRLFFGTT